MISRTLHQFTQRLAPTVSTHQHLSLLLRCFVAGVFLTASVGKLLNYGGLLRSVTRLGWVPIELVPPAAALLLMLEFAVGLLLLWGRGVTAGALLGGLSATAFLAATTALLRRGVSTECDCFGLFIKLQPWMMLGVDVVLLLACLTLLAMNSDTPTITRNLATGNKIDLGAALRGLRASRHRAPPLIISAYLVTMAVSLQVGFDRQERRIEQAEHNRRITLRYGDPAPDFLFRSDSGVSISPATLRGKWTLICFVQAWCDPCERELRGLAAHYPGWKAQMNVLVVVLGRPLLGSAEAVAHRLSRRLNLPMTVVSDPDRSVTQKYSDRTIRTPFSVLLDKKGIVRFIQDAYEQGDFSLDRDIETVLKDEPFGPAAVYGRSVAYGRRAPDGELLFEGKRIRLSQLWASKPVLLTFLLRNCGPCDRYRLFLERALGNSTSFTTVCVYPSRVDAEASARSLNTRGLVTADEGGAVHTAYQAWNAPSTFLIKNGRLLYASGERANMKELERLLQSSESMASANLPLVGGTTTKRRQIDDSKRR